LRGRIIGAGGGWRKAGAAVPVSRAGFERVALERRSAGAMVVASDDFVTYATTDGSAADTLADILADEVRKAHDAVFCSDDAAVSAVSPAGVAHNAVPVASTGATAALIAADIRSMVAAQVAGVGSVRDSVFILSAEAYSLVSATKVIDGGGATLAGRPVVSDAPTGTFLLVDVDSLTFAMDEDVSISVSTAGAVEMSDSPSGDTITPTSAAGSSSIVSLFQASAVAFLANLASDWRLDDAHADSAGNPACIALTGATWV
jgi:hypothetical protein